jgi:SAM-dependent methyltransferase
MPLQDAARDKPMPSYSSGTRGLGRHLREALALYRIRTQTCATCVDQLTSEAKEFESIIARLSGDRVEAKKILEVGPGHFLIQAYYFARCNEVTAIDTDLIPIGINPVPYVSMLVHNGLQRSAKTLLRKAMGVDARSRRYLKEKLHISSLPRLRLLRGSVCQMDFAGASFDAVLCRSVMHHISEPSLALKEMARVLRPGGVVVTNFHLYTSHNGSLDPRVLSDDYDASMMWAHLRRGMEADFKGNSFLNKMRLDAWRAALSEQWPGCTIETQISSRLGVQKAAHTMVDSGVISGYSIEELTTHTVLAYWQKPLSSGESEWESEPEFEVARHARAL